MKGLPKRFWFLLALAVGTVSLGTLGLLVRSIAGGQSFNLGQLLDAMLEATSYLTLNSFGPIERGPGDWDGLAAWSIRIARMLALVFVLTGIGVLVDALLGKAGNWRFQRRARGLFGPRNLDLICGLAGPALSFIDNNCPEDQAANRRTLVIDAAPSAHAQDLCQRKKVPLLAQDAEDERVLSRLKLDRVARVFVCMDSDEASIGIVFRLARQVRNQDVGNSKARLLCVVYLVDTDLHAPLLKALPLEHGLDLRVFNVESVTVREWYRSHPLDRFGPAHCLDSPVLDNPPAGVHLVVLGDGKMADELLLQALQLNIYEPSLSLRVDVLCENPQRAAERWQSLHACYFEFPQTERREKGSVWLRPDTVWEADHVLPEIGFHLLPGSASARMRWFEGQCSKPGWATTLVVAVDNAEAAAGIALCLAETLRVMRKGADVELWVYIRSGRLDDVALLFDSADVASKDVNGGWIFLFGDYLGDCRRDLVVARRIEEAAQRVNRVYRLSGDEDEAKFLSDEKEVIEDWHKCNEADRASSRQAAAHAWVKQRIVSRIDLANELTISPELRDYVGNSPTKLLSTIEHRRWCAQQLLDGMTPLIVRPAEQWIAIDQENARAWFEDGAKKRSWKQRNRHVDLMPFASLAHLDTVEAGLGAKEQSKDLNLARLTDFIVTGLKDENVPEENECTRRPAAIELQTALESNP